MADIKASGLKSFRDIEVDDRNILIWSGLICPVSCHRQGLLPKLDLENKDPRRECDEILDDSLSMLPSFQDNPPYSKGAFRVEITFPAEYPFKPPKICFKTKIYHPNIDEKGQVCLPIITAENWKPATKTDQGELRRTVSNGCQISRFLLLVIQALVALVNDPEPEHPLRAELAEEFLKDRKKFMKNAEEFTRKHSEKRHD